ncbi:hypothetical protein BJX63DRAFT_372280 [Aspergillus granulosus]|uniref:Uncharacterized protein n=1 Tax=Aspergillus granulosus TaxID=176169 RepID=A0ABR4H0X2_9EURO
MHLPSRSSRLGHTSVINATSPSPLPDVPRAEFILGHSNLMALTELSLGCPWKRHGTL